MKFTLSWLKDHLETEASVEEIAETLTDLGLEVEGSRIAARGWRDFTIGKVVSAEQHPDADRLRVCQVETDEGVKQIICGAPNARAGITVVVAKPGRLRPGHRHDHRRRQDPGHRELRHDGLRAGDGAQRRAFRHHRTARRARSASASSIGWPRTTRPRSTRSSRSRSRRTGRMRWASTGSRAIWRRAGSAR
jgi:hypothetical protein